MISAKFDRIVIRLLRSNELAPVKQAYLQKHGKSLESRVKSETRGDYERLILGLIQMNPPTANYQGAQAQSQPPQQQWNQGQQGQPQQQQWNQGQQGQPQQQQWNQGQQGQPQQQQWNPNQQGAPPQQWNQNHVTRQQGPPQQHQWSPNQQGPPPPQQWNQNQGAY
jgi:hypothetical protein